MGRKRLKFLLALLGCFGFYIAYQEWFSWLLLVAVMGLPWLSLLVSLPGILTFTASADAPDFLPMGAEGKVNLVGKSRYAVPPFGGSVRLTRCTTGEQWRCHNGGSVPSDHCGGIRAVPEKVYVYDTLGLFRFRVKHPESRTVLVRPKPVRLPKDPDLSRYLALRWHPKPGGGFAENHELRLYRPGDNLNQVHWKLTAKTGKLTIREPMEPDRGLVLLTMDLKGKAEELDRKFGRLLWLGSNLLEQDIRFEIRCLTGEGIHSRSVREQRDLEKCIDLLLCASPSGEGSVLDQDCRASWQHHIGGEPDEA